MTWHTHRLQCAVITTALNGTQVLCRHEELSLREPKALTHAKRCQIPTELDGS